jgi:hypothetical protein
VNFGFSPLRSGDYTLSTSCIKQAGIKVIHIDSGIRPRYGWSKTESRSSSLVRSRQKLLDQATASLGFVEEVPGVGAPVGPDQVTQI